MGIIRELCVEHTNLNDEDIAIIEQMAANLQSMADITQADFFIDCATRDPDVAVVIAEAKPHTAPSLYRTSVVGQLALKQNEPAVIRTQQTGQLTLGMRGTSQEGIPIKQSVVPILNPPGQTIGTLIMEQDITEQVRTEAQVELLVETAEQLTETLLQVAMQDRALPDILMDALVVANHEGVVTYANPIAVSIYKKLGIHNDVIGRKLTDLSLDSSIAKALLEDGTFVTREINVGNLVLLIKALPLLRAAKVVGYIMLIRDISEIRSKEKELMVKSAVIQEIHHRVKNNLQTIASLLRLQQRRVDSPSVKKAFADSINRIMSTAIVHEVLSREGLEMINVKEVAQEIAQMLKSTMIEPDRNIVTNISGDEIVLTSKQATSVGLIINELVHNAIDHAFGERKEGSINIVFRDSASIVSIEVHDDGWGFPEHFSIRKSRGLGLSIVHALVEEDLKGMIRFSNVSGAHIHITFPKTVESQEVFGDGANQGGRR
ncbi:MAG: histidine kinase [Firmicutes bacterium]|nr:histidine kinase [Bacillota bacterium]